MKKLLPALLILIFIVSFQLGANNQEYYPVGSMLWQTVNQLCHTAGVTGPSSNGPVTADEILIALRRAEKVLGEDNSLIQECKTKLSGDNAVYADGFGTINLSGTISPEVYFQTGKPFGETTSDFPYDIDGDWFIKNSRETNAPIWVTLENSIGNILYSRFVLEVEQAISKEEDENPIWNRYFHSQFFETTIFRNFPRDAGISIGSSGLNLIIARNRVSLGEGYTGNTAIGDNFDYQEFMKAGFYTEHTSVHINITTFDSSRITTFDSSRQTFLNGEKQHEGLTEPWSLISSRFSGYRELRHSAVYELTLFGNFRITGSFITLLDTTTAFDIRYLNPFMIIHNYFNYKEETILEANNLVSVDLSWAVGKKWNLYLQWTMDQLQLASEVDREIKEFGYVSPNAFGALFNISYSDIVKDGLMNIYAEAVYNMPGMYLNTKCYDESGNVTNKKNGNYCFSQDYLVGYKRTECDYDDIAYGGYIYGGDSLVFALGGSYVVPSSFSIKGSLFYMAHGEKGRGDKKENYTLDGIDNEESLWRLSLYGVIEHTFALKAEGTVKIMDYMSLSLGAAYSYRWNFRNNPGATFGNLQSYIGFTISTAGIDLL